MPKPKTKEEIQKEIVEHFDGVARYWSGLENMSNIERCRGVVFSILVAFDGMSMGLPAMDIVMRPHPEDREYCIEEGVDWYPQQLTVNDDVMLHDLYTELKNERDD